MPKPKAIGCLIAALLWSIEPLAAESSDPAPAYTLPRTQVLTLKRHSYGGLFATFVLLTAPDLFERYLVVSPSYWYDQRLIFRLEQQAAGRYEDLPARVFLSVCSLENPPEGRQPMVEDLERLARQIRGRNYPRLELETQIFPDEGHNSVFPAALSRGLRWLFEE